MEYVNRKGTNSLKWDALEEEFGDKDLLSMWVADMDFPSVPCAVEALKNHLDSPLGYYQTPDSYYQAIIDWEKNQHGYKIRKDWIVITTGVVPALFWGVNAFTSPGDAVMISTPVYYPFMMAAEMTGRTLVKCPLKYENNVFEMDYDLIEKTIVENNVKVHILCNPHNPIGRVWTAEELDRLLSICKKYDVMVLSDEIHQDFINPKLGRSSVAAATVGDYNDIIITMASASKTFNLAAVESSFTIIPDANNRQRYNDYLDTINTWEGSPLGQVATESALRGGKEWLQDLLATIYGNYDYLCDRFSKELPKAQVAHLEGTYLLWIDFSEYFETEASMRDFLQGKCKLALDYGSQFGDNRFARCARFNLATSRENIKEAINRMTSNI